MRRQREVARTRWQQSLLFERAVMVVGDGALARSPQEGVVNAAANRRADARYDAPDPFGRLLLSQLDAQPRQDLRQHLRYRVRQALASQPVAHAAQTIDPRDERQHIGQMRLLLHYGGVVAV